MSLKDIFKNATPEIQEAVDESSERVEGKIIYLDEGGWGFISSPAIKFTRIFFHWTGLEVNSLHFTKLEKGMRVEFTPKNYEEKGYRAIKIRVIEKE